MQIGLFRLRLQSFLLFAFLLLAVRTGYAEIVAYHGTGRVDSILDLSGGAGVNGFFNAGDTITFRITYDTATAGGMSTFSANYPGAIKEFTFSYSNGYTGTAANGDVSLWNNFPLGLNNQPADRFGFESQLAHGLTAPDIGSAHLVNLNAFLLDSTAATALSSLNLVALPPLSAFSSTHFETIYQNSSGGTSYVKGRALSLTRIPAATRIYWTEQASHKIRRAKLDGSAAEDLITGLSTPQGIALDMIRRQVYWTDRGTHKIQRANLDGGGIEDLVSGLNVPAYIALDLNAGKMYWTDELTFKIQRANLDGSGVEDVISGLNFPVGIALDTAAGKIYWTEEVGSAIRRANLDGSGIQTLVTGLGDLIEITLDLAAGKMYWTDSLTEKVQRANLNGTGIETLVSGLPQPLGIELDPVGRKVYWVDAIGKIQRANLDGTATENVVLTSGVPIEIALEAFQNEPPVANAGSDRAVRTGETVDLDGSASFDDNTATGELLYRWTFKAIPTGSNAVLTGDTTRFPSFLVDVQGTYIVQLIVADAEGLSSTPDEVLISNENLAPTARAGEDGLVITGERIVLDGSGSRDPENDVITFFWDIIFAPAESTSRLIDANSPHPSLIPDVEGQYGVVLIVSDFIGRSLPDFTTITATNAENFAEIQIVNGVETVTALPLSSVATQGNQSALNNFLIQATTAIQGGDLAEARLKLQQTIERTDGCALRGTPDTNGPGRDWITDCAAQMEAYELLNNALAALTP